jgi:hypothetical protein
VSLASAVRQAAPPVPYAYRSYEDRMQYKKLGTSDILVSSCCLLG